MARSCRAAAALALIAAGCSLAQAQTWRVVPAFSLESTFTNNVNLAPSDQRKSDWINQFTPSVSFSGASAHTKLLGTISLPILVYARTSENNYLAPQATVAGTFEAIEKFFFVDASANVSQQYASPFGPRSTSLANATGNRYTAQAYTLSPYIQGTSPDGIRYYLRQQSLWSNAAGVSGGTSSNNTYASNVDGYVTRDPRPLGWSVEYTRSDSQFYVIDSTRDWETTQITRFRGLYQPDFTLQLSAIVGYEDYRFFQTAEHGATYGGGIVWTPTDRTNLDATVEHRFFGTGYHVTFGHHTPLSVWWISASRDLSNYPQQIATLPVSQDVNALLNRLYSTRVPDPIQRQALVDQLIRDRGLPMQLTGPVPIYAQQFTLVEALTATYGILGARNSIFFTAYHSRDEAIEPTEAELAPLIAALTNTTQTGAYVTWTHQLEPSLSLATTANVSRATDNTQEGGSTRLYSLNAILSRQVSVLTSAYAGARYQLSSADASVGSGYHEFAVFVGFRHMFH